MNFLKINCNLLAVKYSILGYVIYSFLLYYFINIDINSSATKYFFISLILYPSIFYLLFIIILNLALKSCLNIRKHKFPILKIKKSFLIWLFFLIYLSGYITSIKTSSNDDKFLTYQNNFFIIYAIAILVLAPIFEEFIFRHFLLLPFLKNNSLLRGIIITSFFFALFHFPLFLFEQTFSFIDFIDYFIFGLILGSIRILSGLKYAIIAHSFRNILSFLANYHILNLFFIEKITEPSLFYLVYVIVLLFLILNILFLFFKLIKLKF